MKTEEALQSSDLRQRAYNQTLRLIPIWVMNLQCRVSAQRGAAPSDEVRSRLGRTADRHDSQSSRRSEYPDEATA